MYEFDKAEYGTDENMKKAVEMFEEGLRTCGKDTINAMVIPEFQFCSIEKKSYVAALDVKAWMGNPWGSIHGGIIATAFDTCMGIAAFYFGGCRRTQTLSVDISYLRAGKLGQKMFVESKITKAGRTVVYATASAWCEETPDKLIATATGVYFLSDGMPFADKVNF